jgi:hypothetical protein
VEKGINAIKTFFIQTENSRMLEKNSNKSQIVTCVASLKEFICLINLEQVL